MGHVLSAKWVTDGKVKVLLLQGLESSGTGEGVPGRERACGRDREVREWGVAPCCQSRGGGSGRNLWKMNLVCSQGRGQPPFGFASRPREQGAIA